ncbi:peptidoglycan endopeptidase [Streptomyces sp. AJS327]|nr:peptidoglycan endopeptidase [Streptomyces sp. AJS327]
MNLALRAGMTGGVMGTIALTASAAPASATDRDAAAETQEMPTLTSDLTVSNAQAASSLETSAHRYELREARDSATAEAVEEARAKAKETKQRAEAKARAKAEAAREAEEARQARAESAERANRSTERGSLASASAEAPSAAPQSGNAAGVISFLRAQVGKGYVLGATGPSSYDCSGLTLTAFKRAGIDLPRTSQQQSTTGTSIPVSEAKPGDILYWGGAGSAHHVAVYVGGGKFIGAQNPSTGVVERDLSYDQPSGAVRVL